MNRNSENRFAENPQVGISRSRFQRNSDNKTTFNTGELIPIYLDEVLPGDTHQIDVACVAECIVHHREDGCCHSHHTRNIDLVRITR